MADYIRRDDALFALRKAERGGSMTALTRLERAYAEIREMPAADVAEVVRCGYCCRRGEKKATMRLIDANAVYNEALENHQKGEIEDWEFDSIINYLDGAPTINTVEIVYCKDCKHKVRADANGIVICSEEHGMYCPTESDFCRYGEYRTNTGGVTE